MWLHAEAERSARATLARALSAQHWDKRAEARIAAADDPFALAKAKELAWMEVKARSVIAEHPWSRNQ